MAGKVSGQGVGEPACDVRPDALHGLQRSDVGKVHFGEMRQGDDLRSQQPDADDAAVLAGVFIHAPVLPDAKQHAARPDEPR